MSKFYITYNTLDNTSVQHKARVIDIGSMNSSFIKLDKSTIVDTGKSNAKTVK